ncbi:DUF4190 domain-containing protein [Streptacidiphilus sp. P02-A3a]|nr:DUF4190 domain-containing protein [Streptacidiphilus sp. P02-A3a]
MLGLLALAPVSVAFGIVALVRIGRTRQRGKGLAVAGLVLSGAWCLVGVVALLLGAAYVSAHPGALSPSSAMPGISGMPGMRLVSGLGPGSCFDLPPQRAVTGWVTVVSCIQPHDRQLYAKVDFGGGYPGAAEAARQTQLVCLKAMGADFLDPEGILEAARPFGYVPTPAAYRARKAQAWCTLAGQSGQLSENLMQATGDYTAQQLAFLRTTEQTTLIRSGMTSTVVGDLEQARDFAAQLASADRAEARQLLGLRFPAGPERGEAAAIARDDLAEAEQARAFAAVTTEGQAQAVIGRMAASALSSDVHTIRIQLGLDAA